LIEDFENVVFAVILSWSDDLNYIEPGAVAKLVVDLYRLGTDDHDEISQSVIRIVVGQIQDLIESVSNVAD
jgi:hypothetical protein